MANLSFKQGNLSNISNNDTSNGVVYFSKDDTSGHSAHGYIFYDDEIDRIPINGSGYYMAPDKKNNALKSMFIENNLFNSGAGAFIGVGHNNKDLWLHKSSTSGNPNRGLWSPLWGGSEEEPIDSGAWILRVGKHSDSSIDPAEYLYLGSPKYINENGIESNIYTIRPAAKNSYLLGDTEYKWADIHTLNITSNTGTFSSKLTVIDKSDTENNTGIDCQGNKIIIAGDCTGSKEHPELVIGDIGPQILFTRHLDQSASGNQKIALIYSTHDDVFTGNSITLATTETEAAFISPVLIAKNRVMTSNISNVLKISSDRLTPQQTDSSIYLGDSTHRWKKIYTLDIDANGNLSVQGTTITSGLITANGGIAGNLTGDVTGNLTGNASTATKLKTARTFSVGDQSGSFDGSKNLSLAITAAMSCTDGTSGSPQLGITVNGVPSSKVTIPTASSTVYGVVTTGGQTFAGEKSFASATTFKNMVWIKNPKSTNQTGHFAVETAKDVAGKDRRTLCMGISYSDDTKSYSRLLLVAGPDSTLSPLYISSEYKEVPSYISLGTSSRPWVQLFATDDSINASDIRLKEVQDETYLQRLLQVYDQVSPIAYKRKNLSKYDDYKRIHIGLSAQEVEEKMIANNLTNLDFGGLCIDSVDPDIEVYKKVLLDGKKYSLRYGEFHGLHILKNHQQDARLTELENKNKELENTIATLKTQIELLKLAVGG